VVDTIRQQTGSLQLEVILEGRYGPIHDPQRTIPFKLVSPGGAKNRKLKAKGGNCEEEVPPGNYSLRILRFGSYPYGTRFRWKRDGADGVGTAVDVVVPDGGEVHTTVVLTERPLRRLGRAAFCCLVLALLLWELLREDSPTRPESEEDVLWSIVFGLWLMVTIVASAFMTINHTRKHLREYRKRAPTSVSRSRYTYVADLLVIAGFVLGSALAAYLTIDGLADTGKINVVTESSSVSSAKDVIFGVLWHMADAVPAVGLPDVWGWKNPIAVRGNLAWLANLPLITMRLLVAVGVIGFAFDCWNALTTRGAPATTQQS